MKICIYFQEFVQKEPDLQMHLILK
jgi:hypothetical protein